MRQIRVADDKNMRLSGRDGEFDEGVEVGMVAALMSLGQNEIRRRVALASIDQLLAVAAEFEYRLGARRGEGDWVELTFLSPKARWRPRLAYVRAAAAG